MEYNLKNKILSGFTILFIFLFGTYYIPIDGRGGFGILHFVLMASAVFVFIAFEFKVTKALLCGIAYLMTQFAVAFYHPESLRWSTLFFSAALVSTYICFYNLIYAERIFSIDYFIKICKWMIMTYFVVCLLQQALIICGITYFPFLNLTYFVDRGIGCHSLSMEPSTFARSMLVFYYAYLKCNEYKRGEGKFTFKELIAPEHRLITLSFLWMMTTMGSGTAFVCLFALSLYFVRRTNWFYIVPTALTLYLFVLPLFHFEQMDRAIAVTSALTTMDQRAVEEADGSGASRISPILNSFKADFSDPDTWFGHGVDYARKNNFFITQKGTLFDDYGLIFYIIAMAFDLICGYRFLSLATLFMFMGVGGGAGTNIHYTWYLMIIMTFVRYYYENQDNPEIYEHTEDEKDNYAIEPTR